MSLSVDMALNAIAHYPMSLIPANTHLSLRERQNAAVRSEIVQSGIKRFLDCGFDETTTDENGGEKLGHGSGGMELLRAA